MPLKTLRIMGCKKLFEWSSGFESDHSDIITIVNQLDTMFEKLDQQYTEELEYKIGVMSSLLEPIMIIIVGILVAVILVAMYLPMFQLGTAIY